MTARSRVRPMWRKLWVVRAPAFEQLSPFERGIGDELMVACDNEGRVLVGENELDSVCRLLRALPTDRRRLRESIARLIGCGFLVREAGALRIVDFADDQERVSPEAERKRRERERRRHSEDDAPTPAGRSRDGTVAPAEQHDDFKPTPSRGTADITTSASPGNYGDSGVTSHGRVRGEEERRSDQMPGEGTRRDARSLSLASPRAPARVPAREPPPAPLVRPNDGEASELLVAALADGAGDLWADDGEAWRRERLGAELVARDFDEDGARHFGRFLRRTGVAESLSAKRFSPYWLVFGPAPQRAEFRHLDAAVEAFDRWCDAEEARLKSEAEQRRTQLAREEKKASPPVRSAEAVSAAMRKAREDFKHLPKPRAAIEDDESIDDAPAEPNTTGAERARLEDALR